MSWHVFRLEDHMGLVGMFVNRYRWAATAGRICEDDLRQEGRIALMRAVKRFDPSRGAMFSTYAWKAIQTGMLRLVEGISFAVHYPHHYRWSDPVESRKRGTVNLDLSLLLETAADDSQEHVYFEREKVEATEDIFEKLAKCKPRFAEVIRRRYIEGETMESIGESLGISRQGVQQIEVAAFKHLRRLPSVQRMKHLLEAV